MKNILYFFIAAIVLAVIASLAINTVERRECRAWQQDNTQVRLQWQIDQCAHHNLPVQYPGKIDSGAVSVSYNPQDVEVLEFKVWQDGTASWYDYDLAGLPGYSKTHRTAASTFYKRGTMLKVCTSVEQTKCVEVLVNDYGPSPSVHPDRVIDLSSHAFAQLYPLSQGVGQVYITEVK